MGSKLLPFLSTFNSADGFEESTLDDLADFKAKAVKSDIIVLCVGEFPSTEKPGDISSLNL